MPSDSEEELELKHSSTEGRTQDMQDMREPHSEMLHAPIITGGCIYDPRNYWPMLQRSS